MAWLNCTPSPVDLLAVHTYVTNNFYRQVLKCGFWVSWPANELFYFSEACKMVQILKDDISMRSTSIKVDSANSFIATLLNLAPLKLNRIISTCSRKQSIKFFVLLLNNYTLLTEQFSTILSSKASYNCMKYSER